MHNASDTFAVLFRMRFKFPNDFKTRFKTSVLSEVCHVNFIWCNICLWFHASLIYINNCPTRCNTKQPIYYSASSHYMFLVSNTTIIRITQNCNYSLGICHIFLQLPPSNVAKLAWPPWREVAVQKYDRYTKL